MDAAYFRVMAAAYSTAGSADDTPRPCGDGGGSRRRAVSPRRRLENDRIPAETTRRMPAENRVPSLLAIARTPFDTVRQENDCSNSTNWVTQGTGVTQNRSQNLGHAESSALPQNPIRVSSEPLASSAIQASSVVRLSLPALCSQELRATEIRLQR